MLTGVDVVVAGGSGPLLREPTSYQARRVKTRAAVVPETTGSGTSWQQVGKKKTNSICKMKFTSSLYLAMKHHSTNLFMLVEVKKDAGKEKPGAKERKNFLRVKLKKKKKKKKRKSHSGKYSCRC